MWGAGEAPGMSPLSRLIQSVLEAPEMFVDVAAQGPISAILLAMGALLVAVAVAVFGGLTAAAIVRSLTPSSSPGRRHSAE